MTITITKSGDDYQIAATNLPAPLVISATIAAELAQALISPDLSVAAWKQDKLVYAPVSREPIGVWVSEKGQASIWLAGQSEDLTVDEAKALANVILLASAKFPVGTEVQSNQTLYTYENGDISDVSNGSASREQVGVITEVYARSGYTNLYYKVNYDGKIAPDVSEDYLRPADPIQTWVVTDTGTQCFERSIDVQARTSKQARTMAQGIFKGLPDSTWVPQSRVCSNNDYDVQTLPDTTTDVDLNAEEGFITGKFGIQAYRDTDNVSIFEGDDAAATKFVRERAIAGSPRHIRALLSVIDARG